MPGRINKQIGEEDSDYNIDDTEMDLEFHSGSDDVTDPQTGKKVEKRNTRERTRIGVINTTYQTLRKFFPPKKSGRRMSKLEILQRTINYIKDLNDALDRGVLTSPTVLANADLPKRPRAKRSKGRKILKDLMKDNENLQQPCSDIQSNATSANQPFSTDSYQAGPSIDYPQSTLAHSSHIDVRPLSWQTQVEVNTPNSNLNFSSCAQHSDYQPAMTLQQAPARTHHNIVAPAAAFAYPPSSLNSPLGSDCNSSHSYATQNSFGSHDFNQQYSGQQQADYQTHEAFEGIVDWIQSNDQFDDLNCVSSSADYPAAWNDDSYESNYSSAAQYNYTANNYSLFL